MSTTYSAPKQRCPRCETWNDMINRCAVCGYDLSENVLQYQKELAWAEFERRSNTPENKARQKAIQKALRKHSKTDFKFVLEVILALITIISGIFALMKR